MTTSATSRDQPDRGAPSEAVPLRDRPFRALGGQPPFAPDEIESFVEQRRIAVLAYVRRDGRPNQSPIWYTYRDGSFHMTTTSGSAKHLALGRNPVVSLTIQDEAPPYRAVIVDGTVELSELDPGNDPTAGMAIRYFGRAAAAAYDRMTKEIFEAAGTTLITLVPDEVKGFDNTKVLGSAELAFVRLRERLPLPRTWL